VVIDKKFERSGLSSEVYNKYFDFENEDLDTRIPLKLSTGRKLYSSKNKFKTVFGNIFKK